MSLFPQKFTQIRQKSLWKSCTLRALIIVLIFIAILLQGEVNVGESK